VTAGRGTRVGSLVLAPLVAAFVVLAAGTPAASADPTVLSDPNDATGLDISQVTLAADVPPPVWTIRTFRAWTIHKLWDRGYFYVELDTSGTDAPEYRALVRSDGRKMLGALYRIQPTGPDVKVGNLRAHKLNSRSVAVRIPLSKLMFGPDRTAYRWDVLTSFLSSKCSGGTCFDRAPDQGTVKQPLPS